MCVAIDFTSSNGYPYEETSKHYILNQPTDYQNGIVSCNKIIEHFSNTIKICIESKFYRIIQIRVVDPICTQNMFHTIFKCLYFL